MLKVDIKSFSYSDREVLSQVSFNLGEGEHMAVLGESGCGKSTLLHLIYGSLQLEQGTIVWKNIPLLGPSNNLIPGESFIKLVAQESDVMPFISVAENIAEYLTRENKQKDAERVEELLEVVGLTDYKHIKAQHLSGGQIQRVALARALAKKPELLLLDEPFSSIDTFRKNYLRRTLFAYLKEQNISCITATHDSEEALAFSDQLLILKKGHIDTFGTPQEVYADRSSAYRVGFFGEVTTLPKQLFYSENTSEELFLLPHELVVSKAKTTLQVKIKKSYFKGNKYLIQGNWNGNDLFFNHSEKIEHGTLLYLKKNE